MNNKITALRNSVANWVNDVVCNSEYRSTTGEIIRCMYDLSKMNRRSRDLVIECCDYLINLEYDEEFIYNNISEIEDELSSSANDILYHLDYDNLLPEEFADYCA